MPKKYKVTGFARFVVVMLFITPVAFLAASYFNGEDGIQNLKRIFGSEDNTVMQEEEILAPETETKVDLIEIPAEERSTPTPSPEATEKEAAFTEEMEQLQQELSETEQELTELKATNYDLRQEIKAKDAELERLRVQLENSTSAEGGNQ